MMPTPTPNAGSAGATTTTTSFIPGTTASLRFVCDACVWHEEVTSTNDVARDHYRKLHQSGVFHCADQQTAGRGRYGKLWSSPIAKGFYGSMVIADPGLLRHVGLLQFAASLAAAETVEGFMGNQAIHLKWPNDLILNGKKVGGVLVEVNTLGNNFDHAVIGVGLNLLQSITDFPAQIEFPATSILAETGVGINPRQIPTPLARRLDSILTVIAEGRLDDFWATYNDRWYDMGRAVTVQYGNGMVFSGEVKGISPSGGIILDTPQGREKLMAGTLRYQKIEEMAD